MPVAIIAKCDAAGLTVTVEKVRVFDQKSDAFGYEMKLVAKYGRLNAGTDMLCNRTDGGGRRNGAT
jgi:hypothetical protein